MKRWLLTLRGLLSGASGVVRLDGDGHVEVLRGGVPAGVVAEFREVARRDGSGPGLILIGSADGRIRFAGRIAAQTQQRLRNVWFSQSDSKRLLA